MGGSWVLGCSSATLPTGDREVRDQGLGVGSRPSSCAERGNPWSPQTSGARGVLQVSHMPMHTPREHPSPGAQACESYKSP